MAGRRIEQTRTRAVVMQAVLVGVLAGSVGLAALAKNYIERATGVTLSSPFEAGTMRLQLPVGWEYQAASDTDASAIFAQSPAGDAPARQIEVHHLSNPQRLAPKELLALPSVLHPSYPRDLAVRSPVAFVVGMTQAPVAGKTGVMIEGYRVASEQGEGTLHEVFIAGAVDGTLVLVKLKSHQGQDAEGGFGDRTLARQVAESVEVIHPLGSGMAEKGGTVSK